MPFVLTERLSCIILFKDLSTDKGVCKAFGRFHLRGHYAHYKRKIALLQKSNCFRPCGKQGRFFCLIKTLKSLLMLSFVADK